MINDLNAVKEDSKINFFEHFKGNVIMNFPPSLFSDKNINASDILVYGIIDALAYKKGFCFASNLGMGTALGLSTRTIQRAINKLENKHYIVRRLIPSKTGKYRIITTVDLIKKEQLDQNRANLEISQEEFDRVMDFDY